LTPALCPVDWSLRLYRYRAPGKLLLPIQTPNLWPKSPRMTPLIVVSAGAMPLKQWGAQPPRRPFGAPSRRIPSTRAGLNGVVGRGFLADAEGVVSPAALL